MGTQPWIVSWDQIASGRILLLPLLWLSLLLSLLIDILKKPRAPEGPPSLRGVPPAQLRRPREALRAVQAPGAGRPQGARCRTRPCPRGLLAAVTSLPAVKGALGSNWCSPAAVPRWQATSDGWGGCVPTQPSGSPVPAEGLPQPGLLLWGESEVSLGRVCGTMSHLLPPWLFLSFPRTGEHRTLSGALWTEGEGESLVLLVCSINAEFAGWVRLKSLLFFQEAAGMLLRSLAGDNKIPEKSRWTCTRLHNVDCWHFR